MGLIAGWLLFLVIAVMTGAKATANYLNASVGILGGIYVALAIHPIVGVCLFVFAMWFGFKLDGWINNKGGNDGIEV